MPQLDCTEQLALLTALQKAVKARLDEVRAEADAEMRDAFDEGGVTKRALSVGGVKVGDFIVVMESSEWAIADREALEDFTLAYGFATVRREVRPEYRARALEIVADALPEAVAETVELDPKWQANVTNVGGIPFYLDSGAIVPGLSYVGQRPRGTQVRGCKPESVLPIVQRLGGVDRLLLGDGAQA